MHDFRQRADEELEKTRPIIEAFPWGERQYYAMWLVQTYHIVSHSTRLVALASGYMPIGRDALHDRFADHTREERGHPEWCLDDLASLKHRLSDYPCLYQAAALGQIQYYWIQHRGATSLLGYILSLECLAEKFGPPLAARVAQAHTSQAAKFLQGHAEADVEHVAKALDQVQALSSDERAAAWENFQLSASLYRGMLEDIMKHFV